MCNLLVKFQEFQRKKTVGGVDNINEVHNSKCPPAITIDLQTHLELCHNLEVLRNML